MDQFPDICELARALIRCPSVTPVDAGALDVVQKVLETMGFICHRLPFGDGPTGKVENLYAKFGTGRPNFCYAGHTDVVPPGETDSWSFDPFEASLDEGMIYGRGAVDMKGAIAAFVDASRRYLSVISEKDCSLPGAISLLITGDEEGSAINGTKKVLEWLRANGETLDDCLVGEPTNSEQLGDMVKIGRRGSLNARVVVKGVQGHVAYPGTEASSVHRLVRLLASIERLSLDAGTEYFQPSNLEITSIDVGNHTTNVVPARASAQFNIRFNDRHDGESLRDQIHNWCNTHAKDFDLDIEVSGEAFLTAPGKLSDVVSAAVAGTTGRKPILSTSGGTSDARFIKDICPVVEFGLISRTMHKVDECVSVSDLSLLSDVYLEILERYFSEDSP
mgnify:FL=1